MIAVDTNAWISYFQDTDQSVVKNIDEAIDSGELCLPPPVISELASDPNFPQRNLKILKQAIFLELSEDYWERAGVMRSRLIKKGYKPKLPDTLIAQICIDHSVALLTLDKGFSIFQKHEKLKLVKL